MDLSRVTPRHLWKAGRGEELLETPERLPRRLIFDVPAKRAQMGEMLPGVRQSRLDELLATLAFLRFLEEAGRILVGRERGVEGDLDFGSRRVRERVGETHAARPPRDHRIVGQQNLPPTPRVLLDPRALQVPPLRLEPPGEHTLGGFELPVEFPPEVLLELTPYRLAKRGTVRVRLGQAHVRRPER